MMLWTLLLVPCAYFLCMWVARYVLFLCTLCAFVCFHAWFSVTMYLFLFKYSYKYKIVRVCIHGLCFCSPSLRAYLQMKSLPFVALLFIPSPIPPSILLILLCALPMWLHLGVHWLVVQSSIQSTLSYRWYKHKQKLHVYELELCVYAREEQPSPSLVFWNSHCLLLLFCLPSLCRDQHSVSLHLFSHSQFTCGCSAGAENMLITLAREYNT